MAKIFILEDSYYMTHLLKEKLDEKGWEYEMVIDVIEAQDKFKPDEYDCVIIDLHVDPNGLTVREFNNYSPYYGWAWFENYVLKHNQDKEDALRKKTIIYSKYATDFKESRYRSRCDGIVVIDKSEDKAIDKVIQAIEKIIKIIKK